MANFFQDIVDKAGSLLTAPSSTQNSPTQSPLKLGDISPGNFFSDLVKTFVQPQQNVFTPPPPSQKSQPARSVVNPENIRQAFLEKTIPGAVVTGVAVGDKGVTAKEKFETEKRLEFVRAGFAPEEAKRKATEEFNKQIALETGTLVVGSVDSGGGLFAKKPTAPGTKRLAISMEEQQSLKKISSEIKPDLEKVKGQPLTHEEVVQSAKESDMLQRVTTREQTLKRESELLKARQNLAALARGETVTKDFVDNLRNVSSEASSLGRQLNALQIEANPELNTVRTQMIKKLVDMGVETDKIVKASEGVDFTNAKQVTQFYRSFVKPTISELLDEYRYINLLSSPRTHIVNAFSNLLQTGLVPVTKLVSGGLDFVGSALTGAERTQYVAEVPAYFKGVFNSVGEAVSGALKSLSGGTLLERPDLSRIPTGSKLLAPFQFIPRILEASDILFSSLIKGGEKESLALRASKQGKELNATTLANIDKQAEDVASYYVFRKALDPNNKTGQGILLSKIDSLTTAVYQLRKVPVMKWFIPFVQTPMNILKQGIEYSPVGLGTIPGAANKSEQLAKSLIGSAVMAGSAYLAMKGDSTWAVPTSQKDKEFFYASGRQPYSLKIGDKWIGYSKLGPLAYPIAMTAAIKYYTLQNPKAVSDGTLAKLTNIVSGLAGFLADQSYVQGIGNFVDAARGDIEAAGRSLSSLPSQLVPLSSLQRWVAGLVDPVYRKTTPGLSVESIVDNLKKGIPGLSQQLPAYQTPFGEKSVKQLPFANALSPFGISIQRKDAEELYQLLLQKETNHAEINKIKADLKKELGL